MIPHPATKFKDYEDYLSSHITSKEENYLNDPDAARQLLELGFLQQGVISRKDFDTYKKQAAAQAAARDKGPKLLASTCFHSSKKRNSPLLKELAAREQEVVRHQLGVIIFARAIGANSQEISGYIDFHHRLQLGDEMESVFLGHRRLLPTPQDLSFYNHHSGHYSVNPTQNFQVLGSDSQGLFFKDERDGKKIDVDPARAPGDDCSRVDIFDSDYLQVVMFCHAVRHSRNTLVNNIL